MEYAERQEYIKKYFSDNGLGIDDVAAGRFAKYYEMLVEKNKVMNLTAITDFEEVVRKHFLDSCLNVMLPNTDVRLADVGCGAGFPGIPLKIMYPEIRLCLIDSLNKRLEFLREVITELGLENVEVIHSRAEDAGHIIDLRESFDVTVSRAVANLQVLSEYCLPLVKKGGVFIAYKGDAFGEIKASDRAIAVLGGKLMKTDEFALPGTGDKRMLVYIEKIKETPKKYPRKAGTPSKDPL